MGVPATCMGGFDQWPKDNRWLQPIGDAGIGNIEGWQFHAIPTPFRYHWQNARFCWDPLGDSWVVRIRPSFLYKMGSPSRRKKSIAGTAPEGFSLPVQKQSEQCDAWSFGANHSWWYRGQGLYQTHTLRLVSWCIASKRCYSDCTQWQQSRDNFKSRWMFVYLYRPQDHLCRTLVHPEYEIQGVKGPTNHRPGWWLLWCSTGWYCHCHWQFDLALHRIPSPWALWSLQCRRRPNYSSRLSWCYAACRRSGWPPPVLLRRRNRCPRRQHCGVWVHRNNSGADAGKRWRNPRFWGGDLFCGGMSSVVRREVVPGSPKRLLSGQDQSHRPRWHSCTDR